MKIYRIIIILLGLILAGCKANQTDSTASPLPPPGPTPTGEIREIAIALERGACNGTCPVYRVEAYGDGRVIFAGGQYVCTLGMQTGEISSAKIDELLAEFERADFFSLQNEYVNLDITDMPSAVVSLMFEGQTKTIYHYHGDESAPAKLSNLEDKIDEIMDTGQWTAGCQPDW